MTLDEFERIAIAASQMHILNLATSDKKAELYVSLSGIMKIVQSQLHAEDRGKWVWDDATFGWIKDPKWPS